MKSIQTNSYEPTIEKAERYIAFIETLCALQQLQQRLDTHIQRANTLLMGVNTIASDEKNGINLEKLVQFPVWQKRLGDFRAALLFLDYPLNDVLLMDEPQVFECLEKELVYNK